MELNGAAKNGDEPDSLRQNGAASIAQFHSSPMYQFSTFVRAHGVLRKKVRLDFTVGLKRKQRMGTRRLISPQPCRWTRVFRMVSSVMPCKGSRGWATGVVINKSVANRPPAWQFFPAGTTKVNGRRRRPAIQLGPQVGPKTGSEACMQMSYKPTISDNE